MTQQQSAQKRSRQPYLAGAIKKGMCGMNTAAARSKREVAAPSPPSSCVLQLLRVNMVVISMDSDP